MPLAALPVSVFETPLVRARSGEFFQLVGNCRPEMEPDCLGVGYTAVWFKTRLPEKFHSLRISKQMQNKVPRMFL